MTNNLPDYITYKDGVFTVKILPEGIRAMGGIPLKSFISIVLLEAIFKHEAITSLPPRDPKPYVEATGDEIEDEYQKHIDQLLTSRNA